MAHICLDQCVLRLGLQQWFYRSAIALCGELPATAYNRRRLRGKDLWRAYDHLAKRIEHWKPAGSIGQQPYLWWLPLQQSEGNLRRGSLPLSLLTWRRDKP